MSDRTSAATLILALMSLLALALVGLWLTIGADARLARRHLAQLVALLEELSSTQGALEDVGQIESIRQALREHFDQSMSSLPRLRTLLESTGNAAGFDSGLLQEALNEARAAHETIVPRRSLQIWGSRRAGGRNL